MAANRSYEQRVAREELRFARYWDARIQEPEHPLALLAKAHPELVGVVRMVARNAFTSGVRFAEREAGFPEHGAVIQQTPRPTHPGTDGREGPTS